MASPYTGGGDDATGDLDRFLDDLLQGTGGLALDSPSGMTAHFFSAPPIPLRSKSVAPTEGPSYPVTTTMSPSNTASDLGQIADLMNDYFDLDLGPWCPASPPDGALEGDLLAALDLNRSYQDDLRFLLAGLDQAEARGKHLSASIRAAQRRLWNVQRSKLARTKTMAPKAALLRSTLSIAVALGKPGGGLFELDPDQAHPKTSPEEALKLHEEYQKAIASRRWTSKDNATLAEAVRQGHQSVLLQEALEEAHGNSLLLRTLLAAIHQIPEADLETRPIGPDFDWDRVSQGYFDSQRSPEECRLRWMTWRHPSINRSDWSEEELSRLEALVAEHGDYGAWQKVAQELGNGRTPADCLRTFQRRQRTTSASGRWTPEEDQCLLSLIQDYGDDWPLIGALLRGRSGPQCMLRYQKTLDPSIRKGKWTAEEDDQLRLGIRLHGSKDWFLVCRWVPGRTDVQCRERWMNILNPALKSDPFTAEEDATLRQAIESALAKAEGSTTIPWSLIQSTHFPGRTDCQLRRRWQQLSKPNQRTTPAPRKRGRPRSKSTSKAGVSASADSIPKRPRGRPRKNPLPPSSMKMPRKSSRAAAKSISFTGLVGDELVE